VSIWTIEDLRRPASHPLPPEVRLAVLGDPIRHSLSPEMQDAGMAARGIPFRYARLWIKSDELKEAFALLREQEFVGWNLTVPHKIASFDLVDEVDPAAARVGAINTVLNRSGWLVGFNTDGIGLVAALRESFSIEFQESRIAVLGAGGGAGSMAAIALLDENPRQLLLANRTFGNLDRLRTVMGSDSRVSFWSWEKLDQVFARADLIINASSAGLRGQALDWDPRWIRSTHQVFDMLYGSEPTPVVSWAAAAGVPAANGALMLLHQGTAAFQHWFGLPVPEAAMRRALFRRLESGT
jgi:shikimate dehydrogenase